MTTPILDLEEWESAQAQPEVTVNESTRWLECFAALTVASQSVNDPPSAISGDRYIVGDTPTGEWSGHAGDIALRMENSWDYRTAPAGTAAWVEDEEIEVRYIAGIWEPPDEPDPPPEPDPPIPQTLVLHVSIDPAAPHAPIFYVPFGCQAKYWVIMGAGGPGDAEFDVRWTDEGVNTALGPANSILGTGVVVEITAANGVSDNDLAFWDRDTFSAGHLLQFVLLSSTTFTRVDFQLVLEYIL